MTIVDELHVSFNEILDSIPASEISLRNVAADNFRKGLLLSAASLFEKQLTDLVASLVKGWGNGSITLSEFVRIKAIERQYHTYFDWDRSNANKFFSLFGEEFKAFMSDRCRQSTELEAATKAFLELGRDRNRLVHQDYGSFVLEKTANEIYELYKKAKVFIETLPQCFVEFSQNKMSESVNLLQPVTEPISNREPSTPSP